MPVIKSTTKVVLNARCKAFNFDQFKKRKTIVSINPISLFMEKPPKTGGFFLFRFSGQDLFVQNLKKTRASIRSSFSFSSQPGKEYCSESTDNQENWGAN